MLSCSQGQLSHIDTAKVVVESFYQKDNNKLKKHTTEESYAAFMSIQTVMASGDSAVGASNFKVLQETVDGDIAWVQFSTSYEEAPEIFKLVNEDGQWKVTEKGVKEKSPF
ncbi:hypothetical protein [Winogradskyella jejuensis]|nr:hypothetical protein [Winogradskyella jejuensis]